MIPAGRTIAFLASWSMAGIGAYLLVRDRRGGGSGSFGATQSTKLHRFVSKLRYATERYDSSKAEYVVSHHPYPPEAIAEFIKGVENAGIKTGELKKLIDEHRYSVLHFMDKAYDYQWEADHQRKRAEKATTEWDREHAERQAKYYQQEVNSYISGIAARTRNVLWGLKTGLESYDVEVLGPVVMEELVKLPNAKELIEHLRDRDMFSRDLLRDMSEYAGGLDILFKQSMTTVDRLAMIRNCSLSSRCKKENTDARIDNKRDWLAWAQSTDYIVPGEKWLKKAKVPVRCYGSGIPIDTQKKLMRLQEIGWPTKAVSVALEKDACGYASDWERVNAIGDYTTKLGTRVGIVTRRVKRSPQTANLLVEHSVPLEQLPLQAFLSTAKLRRSVKQWLKQEGAGKNDTLARARDRLARLDPEWAIKEYGSEYERGRKIGYVMKQAADFLAKKAKHEDAQIFIHGRDGEIMYEILRRMGIKSWYGLTPRPLTAQSGVRKTDKMGHWKSKKERDDYFRYLKAVCPLKDGKVIHVDSGFSGSVPDWFKSIGFKVDEVWLLGSSVPSRQIPIVFKCANANVTARDENADDYDDDYNESATNFIAAHMEDAPQRMESFGEKGTHWKRGIRTFSKDAPGFWARLYGIVDYMGIKRQMPDDKPEKVVTEKPKQMRFKFMERSRRAS